MLDQVPFELSAAGAKRGVRSLPARSVPSRQSTKAQPAEGRPGPSDYYDDDLYLFLSFSGAHLNKILYVLPNLNSSESTFQKTPQFTDQEMHPNFVAHVPCCHRIHTREGYSVKQTLNGTEFGFGILMVVWWWWR